MGIFEREIGASSRLKCTVEVLGRWSFHFYFQGEVVRRLELNVW